MKTSESRRAGIDRVQSEEYKFPYHYIPSDGKYPKLIRAWGYAASYLAAKRLVSDWLATLVVGSSHHHLDIGCGDGALINSLHCEERFSAIAFAGVDMDARAVQWAKAFANHKLKFTQADLASLKKSDFDSATLVEVLEHVPPDESNQFLESICGKMRPGSQLMVTVPSTSVPVTAKHYRHFDKHSLYQELSAVFDVVELFGFDCKSLWVRLLYKLLANRFYTLDVPWMSKFLVEVAAKKRENCAGCERLAAIVAKRP